MKPGVFTQLIIQLVFAVKSRKGMLRKEQREKVYSHMAVHLNNKGHKSIIINGMSDHVHVLLGLNPTISISDTVRDLKRSSSLFINEQNWLAGKFGWQDGYGAFSYSKSDLDKVFRYIQNQEQHHQKFNFRKEYTELLRKFEIEHDERFLFEFFE
ncbi:IS200/IS605 family transposase [Flammeovirgaceae bacterium SG7u.111]|nr:IS200/IS605 family transposase [Flammeovirgaceae bacterium SG7u.132]WPO36532.1 IS200/IS605 family transposase [Flammeovirgaceae bacterium SG7u.111]